jgi:hypothetical protein
MQGDPEELLVLRIEWQALGTWKPATAGAHQG